MNTKMGVISPEGLQLRAVGSVSRHLDRSRGTIGGYTTTTSKASYVSDHRRLF
jgi:hypothetical protein